jgi:hypothetical protein
MRRLLAAALFLTGCSSTHGSSDAGPILSDAGMPDADAGPGDAASADAVPADTGMMLSCSPPTSGPTMHPAGTLMTDTTWTAAGSPHVVLGDLTVTTSVTLTIEPCAEVQITPNHYLYIRGNILARGNAQQGIRIDQAHSGVRWAQIEIESTAHVDLAYVAIEGGGGLINSTAGAAVFVRGEDIVPIKTPIKVDHVTISDAPGVGITLGDTAGFASGSTDLTITHVGSAPRIGSLSGPYPLRINLNAVDTIPVGSYTGNGKDELWIVGDSPSSSLSVDATLHDRGVPYHVGGNGANPDLRVANDRGPAVTLTIEPGVEVRMERDARFEIGHFTGNSPPVGVLVAVGTMDKPIRFTAASTAAVPGFWSGLRYVNTLSPNNRLEHVTVAYAGGDCGCSGFSCGPTLRTGVDDEAAIILFNHAPSAFITGCSIEHSAAHGITRGWNGPADVSFADINTFTDVAGCKETYPIPLMTGCPNPPPCPR